MNIPAEKAVCLGENVYAVSGANDVMYTVRQSDSIPHVSDICPLVCRECSTCVHMFSCTCLDSALRNTICKHIHLIVRVFTPTGFCAVHLHNNAVSAAASAANDNVAMETPEVWCDDSDVPVPEVGTEAVAEIQRVCLSNSTESEAILNTLSDSRGRTCEHHMATMKSLYTVV